MAKSEKLVEWFEDCMSEYNQHYIDDIRYEDSSSFDIECQYSNRLEEEMADANCETEEDFLDYLNEQWDDPIEWYVFNFGEDEFGKACLVALGYKTWNDFR